MDDPLIMLRTLGPSMFAPFLLGLVSGPIVVYLVARWRAHREPIADPQLGIKVALGFFGMLAFQVVLLGATLVVFAMLSKSSSGDRGELYRSGFGFLVPGVVVFATHASLLGRTNQAHSPAVRRLWLGYNLLITGLFGLIAFVIACQALFSKGSSGDLGRFFAAALVIYGGAWCACGIQLGRIVLEPSSPAAPQTLTVESSPPTGPVLPPLGGGAFPPIDPRR